MITLNLKAESESQKRLKEFLEKNASETLAGKINNGVFIEKDGKRLLNKKNLAGFIKYANEQARQKAAKGESGAFVEDNVVFGWLIHYYEEDDIIGTLYNEDGSEYKAPTPVTSTTIPKPEIKPQPKPQISIFDMMTGETAKKTEAEIKPVVSAEKPKKQPSPLYQTYLKLIERHKGFLILLRLGDFYEAFNDHAVTLSNELDLTLTGRDCGLDERVPMTGLPCHAVDNYVNKLVERGYKVTLAEDLDNVIEFKPIDDYEEPEELSEEEMQEFDSYVDEEPEELPTVSKIIGTKNDEDDCDDILSEESVKAFDKEALCIIFDLFDGEIKLV